MDDADSSNKAKTNRISCTECQRRKQKCSREWPCNHCRSRKVAHLCRFSSRKTESPKDGEEGTAKAEKRRRRASDDSVEFKNEDVAAAEDEKAGLEAWGYMPGHKHFGLDNGLVDDDKPLEPEKPARSEEMQNALNTVPPRFLTDSIVKNFIDNANYHYYATYPPTLLDDYTNWWTDRSTGEDVSPVFTCLLLRILAMSAQYLNSTELRSRVEFELSETAQALTERFHNAAEKLSATIAPGKGGLLGVQQLFLKGVWYKSEGLFVESWHALAEAIREAQEIGMHKDEIPEDVDDFEVEMRRRLWCLLYVFDWQMAAWLHRPLIIDPSSCAFKLPNLRLEDSLSPDNGTPSPFAHMALQTQLCQILSAALGAKSEAEAPATWHYRYVQIVEDFINKFPIVYRIGNPDTTWDQKYPYVPFQRHYLHTCTYMIELDQLKPYLTGMPNESSISAAVVADMRSRAVDLLLKIMAFARPWFDTIYPISAKFHFLIFAVFDTASVLCSSILHDTAGTLPRRHELISAIGDALDMLGKLSRNTKAGRISYAFIEKLAKKMQLSPTEKALLQPMSGKRQKVDSPEPYLETSATLYDHSFTTAAHRESGASTAAVAAGVPISHGLSAFSIADCAVPALAGSSSLGRPLDNPDPLAAHAAWQYDPSIAAAVAFAPPQPTFPDILPVGVTHHLHHHLHHHHFVDNPLPLDFGGLDQIWDWQSLNVDTGLDPLAVGITYDPPEGGPNPNANLNARQGEDERKGL